MTPEDKAELDNLEQTLIFLWDCNEGCDTPEAWNETAQKVRGINIYLAGYACQEATDLSDSAVTQAYLRRELARTNAQAEAA